MIESKIKKELKRIINMPSSRIDSAMKVAAISRLRSYRSYSDCINNVNIILCNLVCKVMDHLNGLVHNRKIISALGLHHNRTFAFTKYL